MLLIYKPSNFITFNDLQDTCSITGQPFYLNYVGFQQTYSFPGHLAPQFWLVSTQLILSIVIRHLYFRWPPDNLLLSQLSSTQHYNNIKFKNASAFLLRDARHAMHDILLLRISALLPEAISDGGLTPEESLSIMEKAFFSNWFCPVCLGILPYSWQNTSRNITFEQ